MDRTPSKMAQMRISVVIDDRLIARAMRVSGAATKREAVELGLKLLLRLKQQEKIRRLRGNFIGRAISTRCAAMVLRHRESARSFRRRRSPSQPRIWNSVIVM
jgi:Arc/MetJ family transcription regulator